MIEMVGSTLFRAVITLFAMTAISGCSFGSTQPIGTASPELFTDTQNRGVLEGNTETIIPQSATGIIGTVVGLQDTTTYLRFEIPASDIEVFMKSTACTTPLSNADIREQLRGFPDRDWWSPEKAETYGSCTAVKEHLAQLVFVDMTKPDLYIVYVIAAIK
jgi:hypothetical protein